jgi:surface antigen
MIQIETWGGRLNTVDEWLSPVRAQNPGYRVIKFFLELKMKYKLGMIVIALSLTGCATNNEQSGALIGAIAGGVIGHQVGGGFGKVVATGVGIMVGSMVGGNIGQHMDRQDHTQVVRALETTPSGQASSWKNPDSGNQYAVTPTRTYESSGHPCREYTTTAWIGGKQEQIYGTACRQADGSWKTK